MTKQWIAGALIVGVLTLPVTSRAVIPVFDEASFAQMLIEAVWWVEDLIYQAEQVANQVVQIEQGILMLENWALSLKNLDFNVIPIVGGTVLRMMSVFETAQNAFFNAALIGEKFEQLYGPFQTELLPSDVYFTKGFEWNRAVRDAHWVAMQQQAHVPLSIQATASGMEQALVHSQHAVGHLQAQQAGNALLGVQIAQANETNALLGTMAHAQSVRDMQDAAAQDQAQMRLDCVLDGWLDWTRSEGLAALPTSLR